MVVPVTSADAEGTPAVGTGSFDSGQSLLWRASACGGWLAAAGLFRVATVVTVALREPVVFPLAACAGAVVLVLRSWLAAPAGQEAGRVELVRVRELARARASQLSYAAHEIWAPLALVSGAAELLLEETPGPPTNKQRELMDMMHSNCAAVADIPEVPLSQACTEINLF